jgi:hypothetical protein
MEYKLEGTFIEACDCFELCPCWVDDDPDEGHCTGLVAWNIRKGEIGGVDVAGCRVVAVTAHNGRRRSEGASTVLLIDTEDASEEKFSALSEAFGSGESGLTDLVEVTGRLVGGPRRAAIAVREDDDGWSVQVGAGQKPPFVRACGDKLSFDDNVDPLHLDRTALHKELHINGRVVAQRTEGLTIVLPELGGSGYLDVSARSGMSGEFKYATPITKNKIAQSSA